jgi:hypothetical protein
LVGGAFAVWPVEGEGEGVEAGEVYLAGGVGDEPSVVGGGNGDNPIVTVGMPIEDDLLAGLAVAFGAKVCGDRVGI